MRLTSLTVKNFKAIGDEPVTIDIAPITMLFGPNSAGKSSILHALIYLREIFEYGNLNPGRTELGGETLDLGGFKNLVHGRDLDRTITLGGNITHCLDVADYEGSRIIDDWLGDKWHWYWLSMDDEVTSIEFEIDVRWNQINSTVFVSRCKTGINQEHVTTLRAEETGNVYISELNLDHPLLNTNLCREDESDPMTFKMAFDSVVNTNAISVDGVATEIHIPLEITGNALPFGDDLSIGPFYLVDDDAEIWNFLDYDEEQFQKQKLVQIGLETFTCNTVKEIARKSSGMVHIGPLRALPNRDFGPAQINEQRGWSVGMGAWRYLLDEGDELVEEVNRWLGPEHLNIGHKIKIREFREVETDSPVSIILHDSIDDWDSEFVRSSFEEIPIQQRLYFVDQRFGIELSAHDLGVGVSQVLPVVIGAIKSMSGVLSIEQPELHIHPAVQVELADLFIDRALKNSAKMILLETHSEHLLLRMLRRVREAQEPELPFGEKDEDGKYHFNKHHLSVAFLEPSESGIKLTQIEIDSDGEFVTPWPRGFFTERAEELFG